MSDPTPVDPATAGVPATEATAPVDPALTGAPIQAPEALPNATPPLAETAGGETTPSSDAQPSTTEPAYQPEPVDYTDPRTAYQPPQATGTDEDLLTGPTMPGESPMLGGASSVPQGAQHWLPALQTAAQAPGAPPEFQNMLKLVVAQLQATASQE